MDNDKPERVTGRPTAYTPDMCAIVIECGKQGKPIAKMALECGVDVKSLYDWEKLYPDFANAFARARLEAEAYLDELGHQALAEKTFQAQVWKTLIHQRATGSYSERTELTGRGGGAIEIVLAGDDLDA